MAAHSSKRDPARKPYQTFPLTPRADGRWCKKIRGRVVIFPGTADKALAEYRRVADDLENGRASRPKVEGLTVADVAGSFIVFKDEGVATGELALKTRNDYKRVTDFVVAHFGKTRVVADLRPEDFGELRAKFAKKNGLVSIANFVQRVRVLFKYAYDAELIPAPVRFGPQFKRPTKKAMRIQKADAPRKLFIASEVRQLVDNSQLQLKAMILLGINAAMGNNDCALLRRRHLDLEVGWLEMPRSKTGTLRRAKLWPETVEALQAVLKVRKQPKDPADADLVFVTKYRASWASSDSHDSPVAKEFAKLVRKQKLVQLGRGFYSLRHTWRTEADGVRDLEAVRAVMGHSNQHVEGDYIERLPNDDRLIAVSEHVRGWLYRQPKAKRQEQIPKKYPELNIGVRKALPIVLAGLDAGEHEGQMLVKLRQLKLDPAVFCRARVQYHRWLDLPDEEFEGDDMVEDARAIIQATLKVLGRQAKQQGGRNNGR